MERLETPSFLSKDIDVIVEPSVDEATFQNNVSEIHERMNKLSSNPRPDRGLSAELRFLKANNYLVFKEAKRGRKKKRDDEPDVERLSFFNGGCGRFPFHVWPTIFCKRAEDIEKNITVFDNEMVRLSEGACAYFEVDYRSRVAPMREEEMIQHALVIQDVVKEFFHKALNVSFRMWVLTCEPKIKMAKKSEIIKIANGMHIIFPNIIVDRVRGKQLCFSAGLRLERKCGRPGIVDDCYKKNIANLRPAYGVKIETCLECDNNEDIKQGCIACDGRGEIASGSVYKPKWLIGNDGDLLDDELKNLVETKLPQVLFETSIVTWTNEGKFTPGFELPQGEEENSY